MKPVIDLVKIFFGKDSDSDDDPCKKNQKKLQNLKRKQTIQKMQELIKLLTEVVTQIGNLALQSQGNLTSCNYTADVLFRHIGIYFGCERQRDRYFNQQHQMPSFQQFVHNLLVTRSYNYPPQIRAFFVELQFSQGNHFITFVRYRTYWIPLHSWQDTFTLSDWIRNYTFLIDAAVMAGQSFQLQNSPLQFMTRLLQRMEQLPDAINHWKQIMKEVLKALKQGKIKSAGWL